MNYVGKLLSNVKGFYNEINSATLTGAIDVVIVEQEDGTYLTSPWHVRFGKMGVLRAREKLVDIEINGEPVDLHMKLGEGGAAFFVQEAEETAEVPAYLATSPLPDTMALMEQGLAEMKKSTADDEEEDETAETPTNPTDFLPPSLSLTDMPTNQSSLPPKLATNLSCSSLQPPGSPPLSSLKRNRSASNMATQTDMTATEVESKVARARKPSGESPPHQKLRVPSGDTIQTLSSDKSKPEDLNASVSNISFENETQGKTKRRRKKRVPASHHNKPKDSSLQLVRDGHIEVASVTSGSSGELLEEAMFDLEMSSDEEKEAVEKSMLLTTMGRSVSMHAVEEKLARTEEWATSQYASAFHPFSDGDITPIVSPVSSRPPSPKSDTEYETQKYDVQSQTQLTGDDMDDVKWAWGELPTSEPSTVQAKATNAEEEKATASGGLLSFMRKTKKVRHNPEQEGIYLDDLNLDQMDPEVAALYLYKGTNTHPLHTLGKDEDSESGRGASLPQSPINVEKDHQILRPTPCMPSQGMSDVAMSLCGGLKAGIDPTKEKFLQFLITYDQFCEDPNIINNPNLVIRIGEKFYNWQIAGPMIMSVLAFQRPMPEGCVESLIKQHLPAQPKKEKRRGWGIWSWRGGTEDEATHNQTATASKKEEQTQTGSPGSAPSSIPGSPMKSSTKIKKHNEEKEDSSGDESDTSEKSLPPQPQSKQKLDAKQEKWIKSLKLTSEEIMTLGLKEGMNEATFSVTTQYQGTCRCTCYIFVWKWDDRIIVSDIDGTITKSDVLGQVLPMIGKDWSQAGIANLYNMVRRNGYKFVYLSARAIGQSRITRDYLRSIRQKQGEGELSLPEGPLLLSPSSLISAFHKEVIERKPEEFKISCLRDIAALFPPNSNPFYCGFGNKVNDVWAYRAVGIPISRVFTVNHRGELRMELHSTFQSSYTKITDIVDHLFPPLLDKVPKTGGPTEKVISGNFPAAQEYSTFTYWREPLPDITEELLSLKSSSAKDSIPGSPAPSSGSSGSKKEKVPEAPPSHAVTMPEEVDKK